MTIRLFVALLCGAALISATRSDLAQAQTTRATSVKSSKSNTGDRMGGGGGAKPAGFVMSFDVRTQTEYKAKRTRKHGRAQQR
jgi:hypothetical protein